MPAVVPGGKLTTAIKQQLHPVWRELGFDDLSTRGALGQIGPTTIYTRVERIGNQSHRNLDVDSGSVTASVAIAYGWATGASFLGYYNEEQRKLSLDQTKFRLRLVRTGNAPVSDVTALVWPISTIEDLDPAISDLAAAYRTQGREFLDTWTDLPKAYERLQRESRPDQIGAVDSPIMMFPGEVDSPVRVEQLAVLADLLGRNDEERDILERFKERELAGFARRSGLTVEEFKQQHPGIYADIPSPAILDRLAQLA